MTSGKARILVTGGNGQLGSCLQKTQPADRRDVVYLSHSQFDITNRESIDKGLADHEIDICINCAAYTAVDRAEEERDQAFAINARGVGLLGNACAARRIPVIHFSTDYVYDGQVDRAFTEGDPVNPRSVYGQSKLEGERLLLAACQDAIVIRTSWLYSEFGHNFVKTMLRLGRSRKSLGVVNDQKGSPTYAIDLANAVWHLVPFIADGRATYGIFNFANTGSTTWYNFAQKIFELAGLDVEVSPLTTAEFGAAAPRPPYSVLDISKIREAYGLNPRQWEDALSVCLRAIQSMTISDN